jgi:hypothetical protein
MGGSFHEVTVAAPAAQALPGGPDPQLPPPSAPALPQQQHAQQPPQHVLPPALLVPPPHELQPLLRPQLQPLLRPSLQLHQQHIASLPAAALHFPHPALPPLLVRVQNPAPMQAAPAPQLVPQPLPPNPLLVPQPQWQQQAATQPAAAPSGRPAEPPPPTARPVRSARLNRRSFSLNDEEEPQRSAEASEKSGKRTPGPRRPVGRPKQAPPALAPPLTAQAASRSGGIASPAAVQPASVNARPVIAVTPFELPCPRRARSRTPSRPRSSRASMQRLKQAAHGALPLGRSKATEAPLLHAAHDGSADNRSATEQPTR